MCATLHRLTLLYDSYSDSKRYTPPCVGQWGYAGSMNMGCYTHGDLGLSITQFYMLHGSNGMQWIEKRRRTPKYRSLSYHREWWSIERRWGGVEPFATLPREAL